MSADPQQADPSNRPLFGSLPLTHQRGQARHSAEIIYQFPITQAVGRANGAFITADVSVISKVGKKLPAGHDMRVRFYAHNKAGRTITIIQARTTLGINVSDEAQTALPVGICGVVAAAWYALVRVVEKWWPWVGVLISSAQSPDGYSKGTADHATQAVPGPDPVIEPDTEGFDDESADDEDQGEAEYQPRHSTEA